MWLILLVVVVSTVHTKSLNFCNSRVYCQGSLLHTVQLARIFEDSKTFVDMKMKNSYDTTLSNFEDFMKETNGTPSKADVRGFVKTNFEEVEELDGWEPSDYNDNPNFLKRIDDVIVRDFARNLIQLWPLLAKTVKTDVRNNPQQYSLISVPNGFIVPGGRFREYYYWDTYWIIKGLLISGMEDTVKGMLDNFVHLIKLYDFVPNGGRIYYSNRSQPPLLTKMVMDYYKYTKDKKWLKANVKYLHRELKYWLSHRTTKVLKNNFTYIMAHYKSEDTKPRPESYFEDFKTAEFYADPSDKSELYKEIKSGAESGWDFSSRWIFDNEGSNSNNLTGIRTSRVIPVDLNSFLCEAFKSISYLYLELSDHKNYNYWNEISEGWKKSIEEVLWNTQDGVWYDYDIKSNMHRKFFYVSNISPLWCNCFNQNKSKTIGLRVFEYLSHSKAFETTGGIATSFVHSGEQWDFPNAWAPMQALIVQGLDQTKAAVATNKARVIATEWLNANIRGFLQSGNMFEKYDAVNPGKYGGGGEYLVQSGFGWSNGVALEFINRYFTSNNTENEVQ